MREGTPKPFSYQLGDRLAPVLRALYPSGVSPTEKLAEVLVRFGEEVRGLEEIQKVLGGKGVHWDAEGSGRIGVLVENTGLRRLAGL